MESAAPRPVPALIDDLLEEILLRIGSPADLARASTACVTFRRLIADPSFLRRYRSLHPPMLLGILDSVVHVFQPAEAPHPSAALARAVARAADFSFEDDLPRVTGARWHLWEVQDGRILFRCLRQDDEDHENEIVFLHLAVCDPLARRCLVLPPIPDDLLSSLQVQKQDILHFDVFLVPSGYEEDDTSFRVIASTDLTEMVIAFIFSSAAGHWSVGSSVSWDALSIPPEHRTALSSGYAYGCLYWKVLGEKKWLKFNMSSMEFSAVVLPPSGDGNYIIIGEMDEGSLGMFTLIKNDTSLCYSIVRQSGGETFDQLKMETIIPLPVGYRYDIYGPCEGHIFISGFRPADVARTCLTLEIKTLKIERLCQMMFGNVVPYFGFPPSMSQRRV